MKRTIQMRKAIMGTGHGNRTVRKGLLDTFVSVPRTQPYPRHIRRLIKMSRRNPVALPKWSVTSSLLDWMFYRAGVYAVDPPKAVA